MTGYVYQLKNHRNTYLVVPNEGDFSAVPKELGAEIGEVVPFKAIDLNRPAPLVGCDPMEIRKEIESRGFSLVAVAFSIVTYKV
jgi:uncharacterized protein YcgL (UPF0745 family)